MYSSKEGSTGNKEEATVVTQIVQAITNKGATTERIGIITPYNAQKSLIKEALPGYEVDSVDAFQGQERDIIIVSAVRTSMNILPSSETEIKSEHVLGFLTDPNRFNVMVTRARYSLVIIGDTDHLSKWSRMWKNYIVYSTAERRLFLPGDFLLQLNKHV